MWRSTGTLSSFRRVLARGQARFQSRRESPSPVAGHQEWAFNVRCGVSDHYHCRCLRQWAGLPGDRGNIGQTLTLALLDIEPQSSNVSLWSPISVAGTCTPIGCPNLRIDNIIFGKTTQWTEGGNSSNADTMIRADNVFGVIDHNTLPSGSAVVFANINHSAYLE